MCLFCGAKPFGFKAAPLTRRSFVSNSIALAALYVAGRTVEPVAAAAQDYVALDGVSLDIVDGEFLCLLGHGAPVFALGDFAAPNCCQVPVRFPMMAIREGMIGLATADSGRSPKHVAPFGGREPRLGTNPISIAVPSDLEAPFYVDMATSAVAAGKIALAVARNEEIPKGWIIDKEGRHTTDPKDYRKGGALLPLGGTEGYKGSGLAAMVEVLCGLLTGLGFGVEPTGRHNDGCFMAVFNVAAFRPLKDFKKEVAEFARYLKSTPPSEGSHGVFYPGEIEYLREQERRKIGIEIEDATWDKLRSLAAEYKIAGELGLA